MDQWTHITAMNALEDAPLPPMVVLDVTNTCNIACIHCPQSDIQARPGFRSSHLNYDFLIRIVDEIAETGRDCLLRFAGDGEPFMHPRLLDMLRYAKEHCQAKLNLTTNGILMTPKRIDALLDIGVDLIDISLDALTRRTYETIRCGGDYVRLMANIFYLLDRRDRAVRPMKVMVSFIEQHENEGETAGFRGFWSPLVNHVMVRQLHSAIGLVKAVESAERNLAPATERFPCPHLWKRLTVDFSGTIKFCAHDWVFHDAVALGNIAEIGLKQAWQGAALSELRNHHQAGDYSHCTPCDRCTDWASTRWDWGYERLIDNLLYPAPTLMPSLPPLPPQSDS